MIQGDAGIFREHCTCGGEWEGSINKSEIRERMKVMGRVSQSYGLRMLQGVVEGIQVMT